jgi:hypothetical protein
MSDVELDKTSEGHSGTEIQAQGDFNQDYVFQGNALTRGPNKPIDGLRGIAAGGGFGVRGHGALVGVGGGGLLGFDPPATGVSGTGTSVGVFGDGRLAGVSGTSGLTGVSGKGTFVGVLGTSDGFGVGVSGRGNTAPGGSFESVSGPQMHIEPSRRDTIPAGNPGDLFLHVTVEGAANLFLCVASNTWQKVQLAGNFHSGDQVR